jgi:hypothetical protein
MSGKSLSVYRHHIVSEWLLLNVNSAIFQLYHGDNKSIFNEMMMRSNTLRWIFIVLAHWNNSCEDRHVAPLTHIILIPSQPVFALSPNPRSNALKVSTLTITSPILSVGCQTMQKYKSKNKANKFQTHSRIKIRFQFFKVNI